MINLAKMTTARNRLLGLPLRITRKLKSLGRLVWRWLVVRKHPSSIRWNDDLVDIPEVVPGAWVLFLVFIAGFVCVAQMLAEIAGS